MNLIEAIHQATETKLHFSEITSSEAFTKFEVMTEEQKKLIDDFFETLLNCKFTKLLDGCGGEISKPLTRIISINWAIEDVQEVRSDLTDEQAAAVLEVIKKRHDACIGVNWETIELMADMLYPTPD